MGFRGRWSEQGVPAYRSVVVFEVNGRPSLTVRGPYDTPGSAKRMLNKTKSDNERYYHYPILDAYIEVTTGWERYEPAK